VTCADHQTEDEKLGYLQWHSKAAESQRKGMKQRRCAGCQRWFWAWEMVKR
jgi:hypothetical protein